MFVGKDPDGKYHNLSINVSKEVKSIIKRMAEPYGGVSPFLREILTGLVEDELKELEKNKNKKRN
jgi:hypothetical protein